MSENLLAKIAGGTQMLAEARTLDEVKRIVDLSEAARTYARVAQLGIDAINYATEMKLRAERRMGEMLKETPKNVGAAGQGRPPLGGSTAEPPKADETPTLASIGITKKQSSRAQKLAKVDDEDFERHLQERKEVGEEITTAGIMREIVRESSIAHRAEVAAQKIEPPQGKYSCIVIDPPWPMQKIDRDERPNQADFDYPTMSYEELLQFPLADYAMDDCHLYLWTTHKHLPFSFQLAEAWGFKYQCLMTWVKNVGFTPFSWMYSTEHVLFCRRGNLPLEKLGKRLDFQAKVREHSRKPDEFYNLVREVSPEPRVDVFSREAREGFVSWGHEGDKFNGTI